MANRHRSWPAILVDVLLLAALCALVVYAVRLTSLDQKATVTDTLGLVLAATASAALIVRRIRSRLDRGVTNHDQEESAKQTLVGVVWREWSDESVIRSLDYPIPVAWRLVKDRRLADHRHLGGIKFPDDAGDDVSALARDFMKLDTWRLVVTGDPGTGKSTLAMRLLLELSGKKRDPAWPVPVLLSLSGWDTTQKGGLRAWLIKTLERDYQALWATGLGTGAADTLVTGGHILPILDGLDELPAPVRAGVISALETSTEQFVLTSRLQELRQAITELGRPLPCTAVIAPKPLTRTIAETYLRDRLPPEPGPHWEKLLSGLRTGKPAALSQMAGTPLGLWLLNAVYIRTGADPAPLTGELGRQHAELEAHLWDGYIRAHLAARPPRGRADGRSGLSRLQPRHEWDPERTLDYLRRLAGTLSARDTRDLVWWRLGMQVLSEKERRRAGLRIWGWIGLLGGLVAAVGGQLPSVVTIPMAFASGAGTWIAIQKGFTDRPGRVSLRMRSRGKDLTRVFSVTLLARIVLAVLFVVGAVLVGDAGPGLAVRIGLWSSLGIVPAFLFVAWVQQPTSTTAPITPYETWRASRIIVILCVAVPGVVAGLIAGLVAGTANGAGFGIKLGLLSGVAGGLSFGFTMVQYAAWLAFAATAWRLAERGDYPHNLMGFLDDAHRLGFLRVVGPVYQFRHAGLQDHLARPERL
ncbi:hypothetical protein BJ992_001543 [Sphaerisporangium rubeum]|uniref:NACHT domain-containing protein n=1 Tax=Sphaerisporangium rubeum TaxID=321317 RepID=A0A7X0M5E5_9ACTN|nr:hypothetical protein [Sphaerisporangium rubeum]